MISRSQSAGQQLSVNDLPVVMEELNDTRTKWYDIGLQLCMNVGILNAIKEQYDDPSHCLRETLTTWLKTCPSPPTWNSIVDALRSSTVGEVRLAADLEQKHCSTQDTSVAATHHHAPPAPSSQAHTQTTSPQQSQSHAHATPARPPPPSLPVPPSQVLSWTTPPTGNTIPLTQPPVLACSATPPSHLPPWSAPYYYSPHTGYPFSTPFSVTPPRSGVATASVHPSYSLLPQVIPTSSRHLLSSVSATRTAPQFPSTLPQYSSPPSLTTIPPDPSSFPPATVTTPRDHSPSVTTLTLGMKAEISIYCTMFHLKFTATLLHALQYYVVVTLC